MCPQISALFIIGEMHGWITVTIGRCWETRAGHDMVKNGRATRSG